MPVDRTRRFSLPGIHDLNKDQDEALALPVEGQHLIVGGPGTGKSVVALLRARRLAQNDKTYRTLVYNHLLDHSNRHLFGSEQTFSAQTWDSWFRNIYRHFFGSVPTLEPDYPRGYRPIDWEAVEQQVQSLDNIENQSDKFLVIDEGQDMPPAFYKTLRKLAFRNFYVAADQNQQIHPDKCSSRQDIQKALRIKRTGTLELKTNYRNTRPVALLAQHFYPADPASPRPDLPSANAAAAVPELWTYGSANTPTLAQMADRILQLSDRNPRKLIGIIAPDNKVRTKFNDVLLRANPKLDNDKPPIQTFVSGQQELPNFGQGGLMIINAQSCKGLEFDTVILADIDQHQPKCDPYGLKARFYVMVARAREQVMLLRTGNICPVVDGLLPTDPTVLVRK
ncbi:MAG: ATP-binding domain-containing protein [Candidatus Competibacteraceae bacterium]|jgi:DNA helicase IV|nr:ATP-binding domain-containing protein [Candidatus Competibacteraceae bacterium]